MDQLVETRSELERENQQIARRLRAIADDLCREVSAAEAIHTELPSSVLSRRALMREAGVRAVDRIHSVLGILDYPTARQAISDRARLCETRDAVRTLAANLDVYLS